MKKTYPVSLILKACLVVSTAVGIVLCFVNSGSFMGGAGLFLYFTIQSNIWIAALCAALLVRAAVFGNTPAGRPWQTVKFVFTVSIALTGTVYCLMLAPLIENAWALSQVLLHVVTPVLAVADFFLCDAGRMECASGREALYALIPPFYYVVFAGVGYLCHWNFSDGANYPYFFLNWGSEAGAFGFCPELPFMGTAYWIVVIAVFVYLFARLLLWAAKKLARKEKNSA